MKNKHQRAISSLTLCGDEAAAIVDQARIHRHRDHYLARHCGGSVPCGTFQLELCQLGT
jgi:hypothetical protein